MRRYQSAITCQRSILALLCGWTEGKETPISPKAWFGKTSQDSQKGPSGEGTFNERVA
jgi:hypothetical protein